MTADLLGPCILAEGKKNRDGYVMWCWGKKKWGTQLAHRIIWLEARGEIAKGMVIDHLCRQRGCINLKHLRVCTIMENVMCGFGPPAINARKTHCGKCGAALERFTPKERRCRPCDRQWHKMFMRRKRAAAKILLTDTQNFVSKAGFADNGRALKQGDHDGRPNRRSDPFNQL